MAQAGYTPIQLYFSTTAAAVPLAANLAQGELAINIVDGKLYYENNSGVVTLLASAAGSLGDVVGPASATDNALARFDLTTGKLIQNSVGILSDAGILTGLTGITSSGAITLSSLTSGRVTYAGTAGLLQDSANLTFSGSALAVTGTLSTTSFGVFGARTQIKGTSADITGATGSGVEIFGSSTPGLLAYNRDGSAYLPLTVNALTVSLQTEGTTRGLFSSTGLAVTGSSLDLQNNGDATARSYSTNASNQAFVQAVNSGGTYISLLQYGASKAPYGALGAGKGAVYSTDSVTIMADTSTGIINFATGGNTERMRITSAGNFGFGTTTPDVFSRAYSGTTVGISSVSGESALMINSSGTNVVAFEMGRGGSRSTLLYDTTTSTDFGTLTSKPLKFLTNGTTVATLDASGNLGLGVTPSAWVAGYSVLQVGKASWYTDGNGYIQFANNTYQGSGYVDRYIGNGYANKYEQSNAHKWYIAPSGTAGDPISFTQAMTLDASGNLGLGATSITQLFGSYTQMSIKGSSGSVAGGALQFLTSTGTITTNLVSDTNFTYLAAVGGSGLVFAVGGSGTGTERARINTDGNLLVGTTSGNARVRVVATSSQSGGIYVTHVNSGNDVISCENSATTGNNVFIAFYTDATVQRGSITYNRAGGLVVYGTTSDYRAKDIIGPVTDTGALIDSVPVYMGKMKGATQERPMFIAHEVPAYAHTGEKDAVDADGNPVYQQMDASALIPVMWAEIQSLRQRLSAANL